MELSKIEIDFAPKWGKIVQSFPKKHEKAVTQNALK